MSPIIQARLSQLLLTSLYEDSGKGTLRLVGDIDLKTPPWFWPPVAEISCKQKKITYGGPPWGGNSEFRGGVQPKTPPGGWTDIVDQTEDGRKILVGRIPHWDEFWSGSPPTNLKSEIPHADVDAFLNGLMRGMPMSAGAFFEDRPLRLYEALPPKMILGSFPSGPYREGGPRGPDPRYPLEPRGKDTGTEPRPGDSSNCWERICCIGLDVEKREVTAIVEITQTSGYGGDLCSSTAFESVGFWLIEPSRAEVAANEWPDNPSPNPNSTRPGDYCGGNIRFIGAKRIPVADIPRSEKGNAECLNPIFQYDAGSLRYSVSLPLSDDDLDLMKKCSETSPRLPVLHAVVTWNADVKNENFGGRGLRFGDWDSEVVQYPVPNVKKLTREIAVGLLSDECPYVRYSNVVWPKEVKGLEWSPIGERIENPPPVQLEKLAVDATATIKEKIRVYGSMRLFVVSADYETMLLRRRVVPAQNRARTTAAINVNDIPTNAVLTPFDLDVGEWLICACFGQSNNVIEWDPERDLVLSGYGESITTSCVGLFTDLRKPGIRMADPIMSGALPVRYRESEFLEGAVYDFPPCILKVEDDPSWVSQVTRFATFYPIREADTNSPESVQIGSSGDATVVVIQRANGSHSNDTGFFTEYLQLIEQFVLLGAIVVVDEISTSPSFYLADILPTIDDYVSSVFAKIKDIKYVLFGHCNGANAVRYALAKHDWSNDDPRSIASSRIVAGILLAPALVGNTYTMSQAPLLVIAGGVDSQSHFALLYCMSANGVKTGELSKVPFSPITSWEMSENQWANLIFVNGATHFRWIRYIDDFIAFVTHDNDLEKQLVLDGEFGLVYQPKYAQRHEAILLSYVSYFYLAHANDVNNYLQVLTPSLHIPPDIKRYPHDDSIRRSYSIYLKGPSQSSVNSLISQDVYSRYRGSRVERRIFVNGNETLAVRIGATYEFIDQASVAPFRNRIVMISGNNALWRFILSPGLRVRETSQLSIDYLVEAFKPDEGELLTLSVTVEFQNNQLARFNVPSAFLRSPSYEVTSFQERNGGAWELIQGY